MCRTESKYDKTSSKFKSVIFYRKNGIFYQPTAADTV